MCVEKRFEDLTINLSIIVLGDSKQFFQNVTSGIKIFQDVIFLVDLNTLLCTYGVRKSLKKKHTSQHTARKLKHQQTSVTR